MKINRKREGYHGIMCLFIERKSIGEDSCLEF